MNTDNLTGTSVPPSSLLSFTRTHHPEFESLDRLDNDWSIFGTLTYGLNPPSPTKQVEDCIQLFDTLGQVNHSHPDKLEWVVRVEYSDGKRYHLHFLLRGDRVLNGRHHPFSLSSVCEFLRDNWTHGMSVIVPYDSTEDGVGYITKGRLSPHVGIFKMSRSLRTKLKNLPHSSSRELECSEIDRLSSYGVSSIELERRKRNRRLWMSSTEGTLETVYES